MIKATLDSVLARRRKLSLVFVALLSLCISVHAKANFTVWVTRRLSGDLYQLNSGVTHSTCGTIARTYLINENRCELDEELLSGNIYMGIFD